MLLFIKPKFYWCPHIYTHLSNIIEAITDDVSRGQMTCQTIFNRFVGVKQVDHGQLAGTAPAILRLVDFLKYFQGPETSHTENHPMLIFSY